MAFQLVVIHERISFWARHLRPRLADSSTRVIETRSRNDLESALHAGRGACPILVIDLGRRPGAGLDDLDRALAVAPGTMTLVLDPAAQSAVALLARELGATHVVSGSVTPPAVHQLLTRWLPLARQRADVVGWEGAAAGPSEPEPWNWLAPYLSETASAAH